MNTAFVFFCLLASVQAFFYDEMEFCHFVIVGGGTAGLVVAKRLSESSENYRVCVIEAGDDPTPTNPNVDIPMNLLNLWADPSVTTHYPTDPIPEMDNITMNLPRGMGLGGCSLINGMTYHRSSRKDFDSWEALGNPGWGYDDVLPYFLKAENNSDIFNSPWHSNNGTMPVQLDKLDDVLLNTFENAVREKGFTDAFFHDWNLPNATGLVRNQVTIKNGTRQSTRTAYYSENPRLAIFKNTRAEKILTADLPFLDPIAIGVEARHGNNTILFVALKEVIVAAGVFETPKLLMLSGIGNKTYLNSLGIKSVVDLPGVGENLQDHYGMSILYQKLTDSPINNPTFALQQWAQYQENRTGYFAWPIFDHNSLLTETGIDGSSNDISITTAPVDIPELGLEGVIYHFIFLSSPKSRGRVWLNSTNVNDFPRIQPNYFSDPSDLEKLKVGLNISRSLINTNAYQSVAGFEYFPTPDMPDQGLRNTGFTAEHFCCTAKMGNDPMAVVDERLKVHGIKKLRVIDAAVMPKIVEANNFYNVIMIAEKGAAMILEDN